MLHFLFFFVQIGAIGVVGTRLALHFFRFCFPIFLFFLQSQFHNMAKTGAARQIEHISSSPCCSPPSPPCVPSSDNGQVGTRTRKRPPEENKEKKEKATENRKSHPWKVSISTWEIAGESATEAAETESSSSLNAARLRVQNRPFRPADAVP